MRNSSIARRYAQALFLSSQEKNLLDQVEAELKMVVESIEASEDLSRILEGELVAPDKKKALMVKVFDGKISTQTMNFLKLVIDKGREKHLRRVLVEYVALADTARKMLEVEVISATELSPQQQETICKGLSAFTGKEVRIKTEIDPSLLGGIQVRIGDKVYDGSARQQLQSLRERLESIYIEEDRGEMTT